MNPHLSHELPFRSKLAMVEDIRAILGCLNRRERADVWIEDLKARSVFFDEDVQQAVLMFSEQVQFQSAYDPVYGVTAEVERAADKVVEWLGFTPPGK